MQSKAISMLCQRQLRLAYHPLSNLFIRSSQAYNHRHLDAKILISEDDAIGNHVAESESAEDIDKDGLHFWIFQDDSERAFDCLTGRFATGIEKIRAFASQVRYGIDGIHSETGAVDCNERSGLCFDSELV